ncbi:signal peptidase I [Streptomyces sp. NBC_00347]|uniref:signal peptidase I n=1 Tax=Streptomyces sp. NBC_00347 TaxID=2975721 RepID=UPI002255FF1D|nr:signal peptidase I [Streptomyces sp. NBC_00347]MCX5122315.1 signal peptidase I [Streptomyces sp. NBC_00347]
MHPTPTTPTHPSVYTGKATPDAAVDRGWLLGHFKEPGDPRHSEDVEIKWGVHPKGEERASWVRGESRTALQVLISGRFRLEFPGRNVVLAEQGDYVVWGRGVDHSWYAEEDSVVLTVRWPSLPGYRADEESDEESDHESDEEPTDPSGRTSAPKPV